MSTTEKIGRWIIPLVGVLTYSALETETLTTGFEILVPDKSHALICKLLIMFIVLFIAISVFYYYWNRDVLVEEKKVL